ncbi:MAG: hypothetical protein A3K41_09105 [Chloroflexi bacterium RIFOXYD12_FULL_57_15]|nr:MAG: hypothetical protein A3K41_09105 [Chloroflexi bacterium RIFOXYD12_FULL_57_15]
MLENDQRKIELANSLLFTLPGSPIIYYGDEIGMGDNIALEDRDGVRTPMQWSAANNAGFSKGATLYAPIIDSPPFDPATVNVAAQQSDAESLWQVMRNMIAMHKKHPALGHGTLEWLECGSQAVAAYSRIFEKNRLVIFNNLSNACQKVSMQFQGQIITDILKGRIFFATDSLLEIDLKPYEYLWLQG